jgi:hypothetical protein
MTDKPRTALIGYRRIPDPFDDSADVRLKSVGVLNPDGKVNLDIMPVYAGIFCGHFYDAFADYYGDEHAENLAAVYESMKMLHQREDYSHMFLYLCMQYDSIRVQIPDPVYLLAGNPGAVRAFMSCFLDKLAQFTTVLRPAEGLDIDNNFREAVN